MWDPHPDEPSRSLDARRTRSGSPNLIVGLLIVFAGVLIVRHRKRTNESIARGQKRMLGQGWSDVARRLQSSFWGGVVGVFAVAMGVTMISYAVWHFFT